MGESYYNHRSMNLLRAAPFTALVLLAAACGGRPERPSILLITIDTLRADRLACYGYPRTTSPAIDRLASEGMLFERVYASLPRTTQSIASILTGRFPKAHGARGLYSKLPEANATLAEILRDRGYRTAAFVSNLFLKPGRGFEQGFQIYDNPDRRFGGDTSEEITAAALDWLQTADAKQPYLLWVHYLDPHWSYEPGPPFETRFAGPPRPGFRLYEDLKSGRLSKGRLIFDNWMPPAEIDHLRGLYDGEIARTDAAIAPLLDRIRGDAGRDVVVLLTADHGESLGEHGYHFAHGEYLYDPSLHVPLIVRSPGRVPAGSRGTGLAMNIDVSPTLLRLAGIAAMQGVDGRPLLVPDADAGGRFRAAPGRELVFAESDFHLIHPENRRFYLPGAAGRWTSVSDGRLKLIHIPRRGGEIFELYDLGTDPGETRNLEGGAADPLERARLLRALRSFADYDPGPGDRPFSPDQIDPEERERLRSLGYIN
ncbi:MAG: sulfatase [Candidatus Polarisedimenticolia bacterium]